MAVRSTLQERRALFKKSPAKGGKLVAFGDVKACEEAYVEGRLESKFLKMDPKGVYFIGVNVFVDEAGVAMKYSCTGKKAERGDAELEVGKIYDIKSVKIQSKLLTSQYSWIVDNEFEMMATKDTEVIIGNDVIDPANFPRLGFNVIPLSRLHERSLHTVFDTFGYVTDVSEMLIPRLPKDTYVSNMKMTLTIADEKGVRLVIENMGNFRLQWSGCGIREDTIVKIKGLELIGAKEEGEYPVWKAHAFDDTIFRVDEELSEAAAIFELLHEVQPAAVETVPVNSAAESEEIVQPPKDKDLFVGGTAAVGQSTAVTYLGM